MARTMLRDSRPASLTALLLGLFAATPARAQVVEYYHTDAIGNVRAITDASGNVIERHDYQPYGEEWLPQGGTQPLRFTGKERDAETGLDYFGARYYGSKSDASPPSIPSTPGRRTSSTRSGGTGTRTPRTILCDTRIRTAGARLS
jgi:hypothetical protein